MNVLYKVLSIKFSFLLVCSCAGAVEQRARAWERSTQCSKLDLATQVLCAELVWGLSNLYLDEAHQWDFCTIKSRSDLSHVCSLKIKALERAKKMAEQVVKKYDNLNHILHKESDESVALKLTELFVESARRGVDAYRDAISLIKKASIQLPPVDGHSQNNLEGVKNSHKQRRRSWHSHS